jgi:hypothetical protein
MLARGRVQSGILPVPGVRRLFAPLTVQGHLHLDAFTHCRRGGVARIFTPPHNPSLTQPLHDPSGAAGFASMPEDKKRTTR